MRDALDARIRQLRTEEAAKGGDALADNGVTVEDRIREQEGVARRLEEIRAKIQSLE
jgi:hypothetical protein